MGKLLGEGAFGTVVKAQAVDIAGRNESTTVAVKMLKGAHTTLSAFLQSFSVLSEIFEGIWSKDC